MGKGKTFSDSSNDDVYRDESDNENFVLGSQQNAQGLGGGVFNDSSGYGNFSQSGRDQRNADLNGALFRGNLGFILDTAVLDVTTSTINLLEDGASSPLARASIDKIVTLSAGDTSDLITILGAQRTGQRLRLYNIDTNTITIKNTGAATENTIFTPDAVDFVLSGNSVIDLTYDITTAKWRIVGGVGGGTPGTSFPILYPKEILTPASGATATIDVSLTTGNAKEIQFPAGDISFAITGDPANTVGEDFYVLFIQDSEGNRSLNSVDSRIKDGELMDALLDKAAFAHTLFRIATLGGVTEGEEITYHPILVNLSTSTDTFLSTLAIDTDKDWAGRFITNLAGLDLFANAVANDITNMSALTFVSDADVPRGQFGRSDFFVGASDGLVTNIPNAGNLTWTIDDNEKFRLDGPNDKLVSSIDLDMNEFDIFDIDQARFIESSGAVSAIGDSVILLNSSSQFQFNTSENNDFVFSLENIPAFVIDKNIPTSDQVIATIQGDNTNSNSTANLNLSKTSESVSLQIIGQIGFNAPDDANAGILEYAAIVAKIEDAAVNEIDGSLSFDVTIDGAPTTFLNLNFGNDNQVNILTDLDMNTFDIQQIDRLRFISDSGSVVNDNDPSILLDGVSNMVFNIADQKQFFWTNSNQSIMALDRSGVNNDTILTVETDSSGASAIPFVNIFRDDPTPESGLGTDSEITNLQFIGTNAATNGGASAGANVYSKIVSLYESVITGREASSLNFFTSFDTGATTLLKAFLGLNNSNSEEIEAFVDLDMVDNNINNVTDIVGIDDTTLFRIIFDGAVSGNTYISDNINVDKRIDVTSNDINVFEFAYDSTNSMAFAGIPTSSSSYFFMGNHTIVFDEMTEPGAGLLSNSGGEVFLDDTTNPPILKIKKKDSLGAVSVVSLEGDVTGPASSTDNAIARFDGTTGKIIQNSGVIIDDSDQMSGVALLTMSGDIDLNTFDIFDIDSLAFQSSAGTLSSVNVGFSALGSGGFRANFLDLTGKFEVTQENDVKFSVSAVDDSVTVVDWLFSVFETTGSTAFQIAKFNGRTDITEPTEINLQIAGLDIMTLNSSTIDLANGISIANVDQIGFRNLGNLIEDDADGLIFQTIPEDIGIDGSFTWQDGNSNVYAILDIDGLFLNNMFLQIDSITAPITTDVAIGKIFMDSGNSNHLSVVRDTTVVDLEAGGGSQTPWTSDIDADGFDLFDFGQLRFRTGTASGLATDAWMSWSGVNLQTNVPTGDGHLWFIGNTQKFGIGTSQVESFVELDMNTNKIVSVVDPTNSQDAATKAYVDANVGATGTQDFYPWLLDETTQYDEEVVITNSKVGSSATTVLTASADLLYFVPIFIAERTRVTDLYVHVTGGFTGSYVISMGIYANRTDGQNYPEGVLAQNTLLAADSLVKTVNITDTNLEKGLFWLAFLCTTDTMTVRAHLEGECNSVGYRKDGTVRMDPITGFITFQTSQTLPTTAPNDMTLATSSANAVPALYAKLIPNTS